MKSTATGKGGWRSGHPAAVPSSPSIEGPAEPWSRRCLLGLQGLGADEIRAALSEAHAYSQGNGRPPPLDHRPVIANLFFEDSTRTRLSFTLAAKRLGAEVIDLAAAGSSANKGEALLDTALTVEAMGADALVIRHASSGAAVSVAAAVECCVINAGDGRHEHPTQGLLDLYTIAEAFDRSDDFDLSALRVAIVGDVINSRVARSAIAGLTALGAAAVCVGPPGLAPASLRALGCDVSADFDAVLPDADAVMLLRVQFERHPAPPPHSPSPAPAGAPTGPHASAGGARGPITSLREYAAGYALTAARAAKMKPGAIVMHPGPMNRGIEIDHCVADSSRSRVLRQVANGVPVRAAALSLCLAARAAAAGARPPAN